jgi:hypothetical protein
MKKPFYLCSAIRKTSLKEPFFRVKEAVERHFQYHKDRKMVKWVSGLNHQFAKLTYGKLYRGFESLFHRFFF